MRKQRTKVAAHQFIEAWQTSKSIAEVCRDLRLSYNTVYQRARVYRQKGVELQRFARKERASNPNWLILRDYARSFKTPTAAIETIR